jgi:hypothetical protein
MANKRTKTKKAKQKPVGQKGGGADFMEAAASNSPKKHKKGK